ncbi:dTDP-4-dehydrorhamnose reductase [Litorimonas sp. WD9-15]|uniref:dTDP-4-dehydrorhamnose reductase n=1 Tax=Litorimonas sp. WD9-15 TaxID=3418716 RepID=UPI003D04C1A7
MSLRLAIIGKTGQLARALLREGEDMGHEIIALGRDALDLTAPPQEIEMAVEMLPSGVGALIIAAAYTAVDAAESDADTAYAVNAAAPAAIARACARHDIPLVHISTDYVFDGEADQPYMPDDDTDPPGVYGASKLDGELAVLSSGARAVILRTSWVFDGTGKNFLTTMLRLSETRDELRVVDDQIGRPTYAGHLARAVIKAAETLATEPDLETSVHHVTGGGEPISWADFAVAIFQSTDRNTRVERIPGSEYPTPAERPSYSVLDTDSFERTFRHPLPEWQKGLAAALMERTE